MVKTWIEHISTAVNREKLDDAELWEYMRKMGMTYFILLLFRFFSLLSLLSVSSYDGWGINRASLGTTLTFFICNLPVISYYWRPELPLAIIGIAVFYLFNLQVDAILLASNKRRVDFSIYVIVSAVTNMMNISADSNFPLLWWNHLVYCAILNILYTTVEVVFACILVEEYIQEDKSSTLVGLSVFNCIYFLVEVVILVGSCFIFKLMKKRDEMRRQNDSESPSTVQGNPMYVPPATQS